MRYNRENKSGFVIASPIDVQFDRKNLLQPDIVFIAKVNEKMIQAQAIVGSPDLVIEILSPNNPEKDTERNFKIYKQFAVQEYWLINSDSSTIQVFSLQHKDYVSLSKAGEAELIQSNIFTDLQLSYNIPMVFLF